MLNDVNNFIKWLALKAFIINEVSIGNFFFIFQYESYFLLGHFYFNCPANIRLYEDVLKTPWRRLTSSSWRRLEDVLIKTNISALALRLQKASSRRLQDIFKMFSRRLENVFKTSSRRLQDIFKASLKCLQDAFNTSCKDILKTFSRHIIKLNCSC